MYRNCIKSEDNLKVCYLYREINSNKFQLVTIMYLYTFYCVLCFAQVFSFDLPEKVYTKECMEKLNINKEDVRNMVDKDFFFARGDPQTNEFVECSAISRNFISESGEMNRDILYHDLLDVVLPLFNKTTDSEIANKIVDECIDNRKDNLADRLVDLHNCLVNAINKYGKSLYTI
ncbi:hypothetical protein RN001_000012 [Aquatica leii]|uniref:Uncharacterized protein n=1 Tax=Aquatica leii TaxID=1421715 RepID=A0AAN7SBU6_9COLE|nr:hypothetical protein RN001_000012 [Aquatica leii]